MEALPKILVILPTATFLHREMLEGILHYAHSRGPWRFHLELDDFNRQPLVRIRDWGCTGIIALVRTRREARRLLQTRLPTVFISASVPFGPGDVRGGAVSFVQRDEELVGRTAADYFLARNYRSFAYIGTATPTIWSERRKRGFVARVREAGGTAAVYRAAPADPARDYARESVALTRWLAALPRPCAAFVVHDRRACQVLACAQEAGLSVPEDLSILGVDNDPLLCESNSPTLSSISIDGHATGLAAANVLDDLLHRRAAPSVLEPVTPTVVPRESTDITAISDPILSRALAYFEAHVGDGLSMASVAGRLNCSVRTLQLKMRRQLGASPARKRLDIRLAAARRLLGTTRLPVADIALQTGFCSASHLGAALKKAFGRTAKSFRRAPFSRP